MKIRLKAIILKQSGGFCSGVLKSGRTSSVICFYQTGIDSTCLYARHTEYQKHSCSKKLKCRHLFSIKRIINKPFFIGNYILYLDKKDHAISC